MMRAVAPPLRRPNRIPQQHRAPLLIFLFAALLPIFHSPPRAGTIMEMEFYSEVLGEFRSVKIYLPEGYDFSGTERYPVVYFLHGSNPNGYAPYWGTLPGLLDDLIGTATINPIILVTPDGRGGPYRGSYFINSDLYGRYEDYTVYEVIDFIDRTFLTVSDRTGRGIMGHSMGGYGGMTLGLKHPDLYCANAALSGPLELNLCIATRRDNILAENPGPPYHYDPTVGFWTQATFTQAGAFWPDLTSPPYYVHFPLDSLGTVLTDVLAHWRPYNPPYVASLYDPKDCLQIYFDCGMEDEKLEYPLNLAFRDSLDLLGVPYEFQAYHGGHNDQWPARTRIALQFIDDAMASASAVIPPGSERTALLKLDLLGSQPSSGALDLRLTLAQSNRVQASLHDALGRTKTLLLDRCLAAGCHDLRISPAGGLLPAGKYWLRVSAGAARPITADVIIVQ